MQSFKASDRSPRNTRQSSMKAGDMKEQHQLESRPSNTNKIKSSIKPKNKPGSGTAESLMSMQKSIPEGKTLTRSTKSGDLHPEPQAVQKLRQKIETFGQGSLKNHEKTTGSETPKKLSVTKRPEKTNSLVLDPYQFMHQIKNSENSLKSIESEAMSPCNEMEKSKKEIERLKANVNALKLKIYGDFGMDESQSITNQSMSQKNESHQNDSGIDDLLGEQSSTFHLNTKLLPINTSQESGTKFSKMGKESEYYEMSSSQMKQLSEPVSDDEDQIPEPILTYKMRARNSDKSTNLLEKDQTNLLEKDQTNSLQNYPKPDFKADVSNNVIEEVKEASRLSNPVSPFNKNSADNQTPNRNSPSNRKQDDLFKEEVDLKSFTGKIDPYFSINPEQKSDYNDLKGELRSDYQDFDVPSNNQTTPDQDQKKAKKRVVIAEQEKEPSESQNLPKYPQLKSIHQSTSSFGGNLDSFIPNNDDLDVVQSPKFHHDLPSPQFTRNSDFELSPKLKKKPTGPSAFQNKSNGEKDRVMISYSDENKEVAESEEPRRKNGIADSIETFKENRSPRGSFDATKSGSIRIEQSLPAFAHSIFNYPFGGFENSISGHSKQDPESTGPKPEGSQHSKAKTADFNIEQMRSSVGPETNFASPFFPQFPFNPSFFSMAQFGGNFIAPNSNLIESPPSSNYMMLMMMNYYELHLNNMKSIILKQNDTIANQTTQIRLLNRIIEEYQTKIDSMGEKLQDQQIKHKKLQTEFETKYENSINELSEFKKSVQTIFKKDLEQPKESIRSNRQSEMSECEDDEIVYIKKDLEDHKKIMKGYHDSRFELENQFKHLEKAYKDEMSRNDKMLTNKAPHQDKLEAYKKQIIEEIRKETGDTFTKNYMETIKAISSQNDDWKDKLPETNNSISIKKNEKVDERVTNRKEKLRSEKHSKEQSFVDDEASQQSQSNKEKNEKSDMKLLLSWDTSSEARRSSITERSFDKPTKYDLNRSYSPYTERVASTSNAIRSLTPNHQTKTLQERTEDQFDFKARNRGGADRAVRRRFLTFEDEEENENSLKESKSPSSASSKAGMNKGSAFSSKKQTEDHTQQSTELGDKLGQLKSQKIDIVNELKKLSENTFSVIEKRRRVSFERELEAINLAIEDVKFHMRKVEALRTSNTLFI